jgi:hypothetical protein
VEEVEDADAGRAAGVELATMLDGKAVGLRGGLTVVAVGAEDAELDEDANGVA